MKPGNGKKKSQRSLNIIKSPLTRKTSKKQTESDKIKLIVTFFGIVVAVLLFPNLSTYVRKSTGRCPKEPYDLNKPGTRLHFFTLRTLLTKTAPDDYDVNMLDCENDNLLCDEVEVTQAACVKECFSFACGNDLQSWACQFYHDKRDKYTLKATQLDCTKSAKGERACTPCRLTYSVQKKKVPCEFPNLCLEDRLKSLEQLSIPWNGYTKGVVFIGILWIVSGVLSSAFSPGTQGGRSTNASPFGALFETLGLGPPKRRRSKKKKKKTRLRRRSSSSSSGSSRSSRDGSNLDTEDELERFFSDSSG